MKRLLHLLWILPLLLGLAVGVMALTETSAREEEEEYHSGLLRSVGVRSDDFQDGGTIPTRFTCEGEGISPHIEWSGPAQPARSYALLETDWDVPAPGLRLFHVSHWVLYDIPPTVTEIPAGVTDASLRDMGVRVGLSMGGEEGYMPSCPPVGEHAYRFRVYALDVAALEPASPDREGVMEAMRGHVLGYGTLVGLRSAE